MAASGVSDRNDDEVVVVTLIPRTVNSEDAFAKRQFILGRETPRVRIGRASRIPTKGFIASVDNAWFDSPVMSRHHAEFILDSNSTPKGVFIKDIGSLHGTFHAPRGGNGTENRLEQQQLVKLSSGDSLRFGTDIFRSKETFPPCVVDFYTLEHEHQLDHQPMPAVGETSNRAFAFYDPDDEDDQDDDSVIETGMSTSHTHPIQRGPSIDLTQDDDDTWAEANGKLSASMANTLINSSVIDLTSEAEELPVGEPEAPSSDYDALPPYSAPTVSECPPLLAAAIASRTARYFPPAVETMSESIADDSASERYFNHADLADRHDEEMCCEDIELAAEDDPVDTEESIDGMSDVDFAASEDESAISEMNEYESYDSMDDDENLDDIPYSDDDTSSSSEDSTDSLSSPSSPAHASSLDSPPMPPVLKESVSGDGLAESPNPKNTFVTPFLFTAAAGQTTPVVSPRDPSPSDAAMFKSRPLPDQEPSDTRAQALGEKTGKYEYFAARESNRTNLTDTLPPPPTSAIRETLNEDSEEAVASVGAEGASVWFSAPDACQSKAADEPVDTADATVGTNTAPEPQDAAPVDLKASVAAQDSTWSMSGERFINNPGSEDLPSLWVSRPQSPEFDMTSAYTFHQSKIATESGASQPRRVGIEDLLTREPKNSRGDATANHLPPITISPPTPLWVKNLANGASIQENARPCGSKRSHEDAFADEDKKEDERRGQDNTHTNSDTGPNPGLTSDQTRHIVVPEDKFGGLAIREAQLPRAELALDSFAIPARRDHVQPSKRRRFAQAAACVALGGAAAFTFMVSTAPVL
ncbi:hypothetical protein F4818DRAFT_406673 [Hypoxylon cercidicola]|nr:hypothetical protein F4818DRAFT_406673 [Hypoxylon cercidicola]